MIEMRLPSGKTTSRIVFGGDRLQARRWLFLPDRARRRELFSLLDAAVELGVTTFDTARAYGQSEEILGAWIKERRNADRICLCTKLACPDWRRRSRLSAREILGDFETSLRALGTDHVDILFVHYDDPAVNVEPIMDELARFVEQGKVGMIGASNWHHARVAAANDYARRAGLPPYAAVSVNFGLVPWVAPPWPGACQLSGPEHADARDFYTAAQLPAFIWASLAFGFFADAYDPRAPRATFRSRWIARNFGSEANHARLERVRQYARERGLTAAQVALAFSLNQPFPTHCIVGCSTRGKLADCVAALDVRLEPEAIGSFLRE